MREILLGGGVGLLLGMAVQRMGLTCRGRLRQTAALRDRQALRVLLLALGLSMLLISLLMWLAVIDVEAVPVIPLHGGTVLGGLIFGAVIGWTGQTPGSAAAGLGGQLLLEGACGVAGCLAGAALLPLLRGVFPALRCLLPESRLTWFRVTLDMPFLFAGGFLGQGCAGLLLTAIALCVRPERPVTVPVPGEKPAPPPVSDKPEDVREDTVVATLPGEEPLVVDTAEEPAPPEPQEEAPPPAPEPKAQQESSAPAKEGAPPARKAASSRPSPKTQFRSAGKKGSARRKKKRKKASPS